MAAAAQTVVEHFGIEGYAATGEKRVHGSGGYHLIGRSFGERSAWSKKPKAVGDGECIGHIVGAQKHRRVETGGKTPEQIHHFKPRGHIEKRGRFVENHHLRLLPDSGLSQHFFFEGCLFDTARLQNRREPRNLPYLCIVIIKASPQSDINSLKTIPTMKTKKENQKKTNGVKEVYNLIVLDRSGSMSSIRNQAIAGVNETVGTIRAAQAKGLKQYVTIITFCGCSTNDFCTNTPVDDVPVMTENDYQPCCSTPLYDALGSSLIAMRERLKGRTDVAVSVTVITDGYENASTKWSGSDISALIKLLTADGWLFAYIGANQDVIAVASTLSIKNALAFEASEEGTDEMFYKERNARMQWNENILESSAPVHCNVNYFKTPPMKDE